MREMNKKLLKGREAQILLLGLGLLVGCAKELPPRESDSLRDNTIPISALSEGVVVEVVGDEQIALMTASEEVTSALAINERSVRKVKFISGHEKLAPLFNELNVEAANPGERIQVSFDLTKSHLIAHTSVQESFNSLSSQEIAETDGKVPLFQYPISSYGIKRFIKNSLGEETRDIEFVATNRENAEYVNVPVLLSNRVLGGIYSLAETAQKEVFLKNRILKKNWTPKSLRRFLDDRNLFKTSVHTNKKFDDDQPLRLQIHENTIYFYSLITKDQLSEREEVARRHNFNVKFFQSCKQEDATVAGLALDNCFLRSEYKLDISHVKVKKAKDDEGSVLASVEVDSNVDHRTARFIKITNSLVSDTSREYLGLPIGNNLDVHTISDLRSARIKLKTKEQVSRGLNPVYAFVDEKEFFTVEYQGPEALAPYFKDLVIPADRIDELFEISFQLTDSKLVASYRARGHVLGPVALRLKVGQLVPLFEYPITAYGTINEVIDQNGYTVSKTFESATRARATHVIALDEVENRTMAAFSALSSIAQQEYFIRAELENKLLKGSQIKALRSTSKLDDNTLYQIKTSGELLLVNQLVKSSDLTSVERNALRHANRSKLLSLCDADMVAASKLAPADCNSVTRFAISIISYDVARELDVKGEVTAAHRLIAGNDQSILFRLPEGNDFFSYGVSTQTGADLNQSFDLADLNGKTLSFDELVALFPGNVTELNQTFADSKARVSIIGRFLYLLKPVSKQSLSNLEIGAIGIDDRYTQCSEEEASILGLAQADCVMKAVSSIRIDYAAVVINNRDGWDLPRFSLDYSANTQATNVVVINGQSRLRSFDFTRNLRLQDQIVLNKELDIDWDAEYLYVPSTHETPMNVVAADPFFQGQEKIVKLRQKEEGIEVYEIEDDERFNGNDLNTSPVLSIPGRHVQFTCQKDQHDVCTDEIVMDQVDSWQDRKFFMPNFDGLSVKEVNQLNLFTVAESCIYPTGTKMTHYEVKKGVINVEVEKTFRVNEQSRCIVRLFYDDNLRSASFKVKYFYSLVKLDSLASPNYKAIDYPITEHDDFGFFTNQKNRLTDDFDSQRSETRYFLNRFNPEKGEIVFKLSKSFDKPENDYLKEATYKVMENINRSLQMANAKFSIRLEAPSDFFPGDLRNNSIVLIDDPLANGLLGYGPSVVNPRTGEIVQAHTNMYGGVLKTLSRRVWESMVDLSLHLRDSNSSADNETISLAQQDSASLEDSSHERSSQRPTDWRSAVRKLNALRSEVNMNEAQKEQALVRAQSRERIFKQKSKERMLTKENTSRRAMEDLDYLPSLSTQGTSSGEIRDIVSHSNVRTSRDIFARKTAEDKRIEILSENNAFHKDFILNGTFGKEFIKGIRDIPGVLNSDGTLKRWDSLTQAQKDVGSRLIVGHTYTTTLTHEIGHNLGLRHNFIGSADKANFYTQEEADALGLTSIPRYSSIMDYGFSELNELPFFGKYDVAALRYAYAREVEDASGNLLPIETTLTDLKKTPGLTLKSYDFCTDGNAGLSVTCNRFDEGTTVLEIAKHYIERYKNAYRYVNYRDGRMQFDTFGMGGYVAARTRQFRQMRIIFEEFEFFSGIFGANIMVQGCSPADLAQYPICTRINDLRDATKLIGEFFVEVLNTPEQVCALAEKDKPEEVKELKPLRVIYDDVKYDTEKTLITSCFEPEVEAKVAEDGMTVVAEGGKSLISYKGRDPRFKYKSDIDVRGVWPDKVLALKALFTRQSYNGTTEDGYMSYLEHQPISTLIEDFLSHLTLGTELEATVPFVDRTGKQVNVPYNLNLEYYTVPEQSSFYPIMAFNLPMNNSINLNELLLKTAVLTNETTDPSQRDNARSFKNLVSVVRKDLHVQLPNSGMEVIRIEDKQYAATQDNSIAYQMITAIKSNDFLKTVPPAKLQEVVLARLRPALPADITADERTALGLPSELLESLLGLLNDGVPLTLEMLVPRFGAEMAANIMTAYGLGASGVERVIEIKNNLGKPPADADELTLKLYSIDMNILMEFVQGKLDESVQKHKKNIKLLPVLNDDNVLDQIMNIFR